MRSVERKSTARAGTADGEEPPMIPEGRIARHLRDERRKQKLSLDEVAEALKIRKSYVAAIESEKFDELPGRAYALGFVGSYAQLLDLDRKVVVARFRDEIAGRATDIDLKFLMPLTDGRIPGLAILSASLVLAVAVYAGWYVYSNRVAGSNDGSGSPVAAAAPSAGQATTARTGGDAVVNTAAAKADIEALLRHLRAAPASKARAAKKKIAVARRPKPKPTARIHTLKSRQTARRAKARKANARKSEAAPASGKARIVLKAVQDTWVQIQLADGTLVISRILRTGESYAVLKNRGLVLTAGNAGGLRIIVDGRTLPSLGPKGAVRQGIRLDADKLLASR